MNKSSLVLSLPDDEKKLESLPQERKIGNLKRLTLEPEVDIPPRGRLLNFKGGPASGAAVCDLLIKRLSHVGHPQTPRPPAREGATETQSQQGQPGSPKVFLSTNR